MAEMLKPTSLLCILARLVLNKIYTLAKICFCVCISFIRYWIFIRSKSVATVDLRLLIIIDQTIIELSFIRKLNNWHFARKTS